MKKKVLASLGLVMAMVATTMPAMAYTQIDKVQYDENGNSVGEVHQTQEIESNESASCEVYAKVGSTFKVTIPKSITLSGETKTGEYKVACEGNIAGNEYITVAPDKNFAMTQTGKEAVTATVTQATTNFRDNNYATELVTGEAKMETGAEGSIDAQGLSAGAWNGVFNFAIALNTDPTE